jgi:MFS family permease
MNGVNIALGYAVASYMGMAFYFAESDSAKWRGPLGIALLWPAMMIAILFIVPESPRFLLMKGRVEEAEKIVYRLHSMKGDPEQAFARSEFYQMRKQTELDRTLEPGWVAMFTKKGYRQRTALAMGFAFVGQSTGVLVINNYGPTLYATLGFDTQVHFLHAVNTDTDLSTENNSSNSNAAGSPWASSSTPSAPFSWTKSVGNRSCSSVSQDAASVSSSKQPS